MLRTLPAIGILRRTYPAARIAWITEDLSRPVLEGHSAIDDLIRFPLRELRGSMGRPVRLAGALRALRDDLRARRFDVALDFQGSLKSALVAWLSGAPRRVGFAAGYAREWSHLLSTHWVRPAGARINRVEKALALAEAVGAHGEQIGVGLLERGDDAVEAERIFAGLAAAGRHVVILSPGTSELQRHKRWPPARYGAVAAALARSAAALPVVVWGPGEEKLAAAAVAASGGSAALAPRTTIPVLAAVLRRAAVFVGGDTGPMHLAWAVGCPVVALFGPTDPRLNAPIGPAHVVLRAGRSMDNLAAGDVARAVLAILGRRTNDLQVPGHQTGDHHERPIAAWPAPVFPRCALPLPSGPRS